MDRIEQLNLNLQNILEDVDIDPEESSSEEDDTDATAQQGEPYSATVIHKCVFSGTELCQNTEKPEDSCSDYEDDDMVEFAEATGGKYLKILKISSESYSRFYEKAECGSSEHSWTECSESTNS